MTSESSEDEQKKRTQWIQRYIQRYKAKLGFILGAALITTVCYIPPDYATVSCDDPSIRRPYYPDTISVPLLLSVAVFGPFFMMVILEWAFPPKLKEENYSFNNILRWSWSYLGDLFVGGLLMFFFNDLAKIATSEPRPSFWSLCSPNITEEQCQQPYVRISWRDCTNPLNLPQRKLVDAMKSFPSGHASVSVHSSVFVIAYIQQRISLRNSYRYLAPTLQVIWAVWALICCQSRIWDNKHHWWDVLAGAFLGACGSYVTLNYFSNWFNRELPEKTSISKSQESQGETR
ncbi:phospholipid phosphatase 2-like [Palaemon carinicauda]|uniref:phospholipid phosphatase 2-like n=1 Tax=Palaemon carinicauda TaxID=392227 RepID=UPI0035B6AA96